MERELWRRKNRRRTTFVHSHWVRWSMSYGSMVASGFLHVELELKVHLRHLSFSEPVRYNPLEYTYFCCGQTIPFGCQPLLCSQVPVGKVNHAHDWLKITGEVGHPPSEHPKRLIKGMACIQREVRVTHFWNFFRKLCAEPAVLFCHFFVHNPCPRSLGNVRPSCAPCDIALCQAVAALGVTMGIGGCRAASTASPLGCGHGGMSGGHHALLCWEAVSKAKLEEQGILSLLST
uniref:Single-strand-selective monofunctional uracil-DNA glycosylase 1 n=1 Tax=Oncorhynchus kisutch TaxID=8019 RepID=A0A8C7CJI5_ONCKI